MSTVLAFIKKPSTWVLILIGIVIAYAFGRFVPGFIKTAASKLPGAQA